MTPTAWGAAFGSAFLGAGVAERTPYLPTADGIVAMGYGMGDPILNVGLQIGTTVSDLSEFNNISFFLQGPSLPGQGNNHRHRR